MAKGFAYIFVVQNFVYQCMLPVIDGTEPIVAL